MTLLKEHQLVELEREMAKWVQGDKDWCVAHFMHLGPFREVSVRFRRDSPLNHFELVFVPSMYVRKMGVEYNHAHDAIQALRNFNADLYLAMKAVFPDEPQTAIELAVGVEP
jgi:hypothetical protein